MNDFGDLFLNAPLAVRETEYSPSSLTNGVYAPFIEEYRARSANCFRNAPSHRLLRYGPAARHTVDLFLPGHRANPERALLVFIHGGYWQELSREESAFAALDTIANGAGFAVLDYPLAPIATLDEVVQACREGLSYLVAQSGLGFSPKRIILAGSSAGAHLAAMLALRNWRENGPLREAIVGTVLVSGIYMLQPLMGTSVDAALSLTTAAADRLSPLLADLNGFPETLIAWGEIETAAFKQQSLALAEAINTKGGQCRTMEIAGRNHFDVILDLMASDTELGAAVKSLLLCRLPSGA